MLFFHGSSLVMSRIWCVGYLASQRAAKGLLGFRTFASLRRLRRLRQPHLLGSNPLRSEFVAVTSGVGVSFRAPVLVGAPGSPHLPSSAAARSVVSRDPHIRRVAFSLLLPIGCGASLAALLVNHFETDRSSRPVAQASSEPAPKLERVLGSAKARTVERPLRAEHPSLPRMRVQASAATHAQSLLRWSPVAGATHYHVVFWRGGSRVLDLWPARPYVAVPHGRPGHPAQPGKYLWLVYAGRGSRSRPVHGPLVAAGVVIVPARSRVRE
jgi:hypothetical protein